MLRNSLLTWPQGGSTIQYNRESEELICKQMLWLKLENTFSSMGREFYTFLTRRLTVDVISCSRSLGSNGKLHKCKAGEIAGLWWDEGNATPLEGQSSGPLWLIGSLCARYNIGRARTSGQLMCQVTVVPSGMVPLSSGGQEAVAFIFSGWVQESWGLWEKEYRDMHPLLDKVG